MHEAIKSNGLNFSKHILFIKVPGFPSLIIYTAEMPAEQASGTQGLHKLLRTISHRP